MQGMYRIKRQSNKLKDLLFWWNRNKEWLVPQLLANYSNPSAAPDADGSVGKKLKLPS